MWGRTRKCCEDGNVWRTVRCCLRRLSPSILLFPHIKSDPTSTYQTHLLHLVAAVWSSWLFCAFGEFYPRFVDIVTFLLPVILSLFESSWWTELLVFGDIRDFVFSFSPFSCFLWLFLNGTFKPCQMITVNLCMSCSNCHTTTEVSGCYKNQCCPFSTTFCLWCPDLWPACKEDGTESFTRCSSCFKVAV